MDKLKALIFDFDGTLADTERDGHRVAFNQAFESFGLNWYWDVALGKKLCGVSGGKERLRYYIDHRHPEFAPEQGLDAFIHELHAAKQGFYLELVAVGGIPLRPGVERLLREARQRSVRMAIATTTTYENVTTLLGSTLGKDAVGWFEVIAAGDVVGPKKPAPDVYQYVLAQLDLPASECLAIEDSDNGMLAAIAAGIKTIITVNDYTRGQDFSAAELVLDQLGEPDAGFEVLAGEVGGATFVDLKLLQGVFVGTP
jgi:HAD superfamily hydrolase (TIGR01509 family)